MNDAFHMRKFLFLSIYCYLVASDHSLIVKRSSSQYTLLRTVVQEKKYAHSIVRQRFSTLTNGVKEQESKENVGATHSLSVAVVLAPTNYPFSLMCPLAEDALKFAKKDGSKTFATKESKYGKTRVNFLVVSGSTSQDFDKVYKQLYRKDKNAQRSFYATLRPYTLEQLDFLLTMLQEGHRLALGRSKLHQLREAILQRNLSTSVTESLAVLRTWREDERDFVVKKVYSTERNFPLSQWDEQNPAAIFPVVTFPWFVENKEKNTKQYSTLLLLYDEQSLIQERWDKLKECSTMATFLATF